MAKDMLKIKIEDHLTPGLKMYDKKLGLEKDNGADFKAKAAVGLQLLNFVMNGSSNEPVVPPIKDGVLRGSGSVFVGSKMVGDSKGITGKGNPNTSYGGKKDTVTVGINTSYAAKLHETDWEPGPISQQSGDVGNKFIEKHLKADGKALNAVYAAKIKEGTGS